MKEKLQQIKEKAIAAIEATDGLEKLNDVYSRYEGGNSE